MGCRSSRQRFVHLFLVSAVWSYRLAKMWGLKKHEVVEGPAMGRGVMVACRTLEGYHKIGPRLSSYRQCHGISIADSDLQHPHPR